MINKQLIDSVKYQLLANGNYETNDCDFKLFWSGILEWMERNKYWDDSVVDYIIVGDKIDFECKTDIKIYLYLKSGEKIIYKCSIEFDLGKTFSIFENADIEVID